MPMSVDVSPAWVALRCSRANECAFRGTATTVFLNCRTERGSTTANGLRQTTRLTLGVGFLIQIVRHQRAQICCLHSCPAGSSLIYSSTSANKHRLTPHLWPPTPLSAQQNKNNNNHCCCCGSLADSLLHSKSNLIQFLNLFATIVWFFHFSKKKKTAKHQGLQLKLFFSQWIDKAFRL